MTSDREILPEARAIARCSAAIAGAPDIAALVALSGEVRLKPTGVVAGFDSIPVRFCARPEQAHG